MASAPDRVCIWAITPGGVVLGQRLHQAFSTSDFMVSRSASADAGALPPDAVVFDTLKTALTERFDGYDGHVCIFSTGIAVRLLAPLIVSKLKDPAVVVVDDRGFHAVSLISGHLGGANALAHAVARAVGAVPVITTATDVNALPAIDMIADTCGLVIENPKMIKRINMAFLKKEPVRLVDPLPCLVAELPPSFCIGGGTGPAEIDTPTGTSTNTSTSTSKGPFPAAESTGRKPVVQCSDTLVPAEEDTLVLRPRSLVAGMGCNRGTSAEELSALLTTSFAQQNLSLKSLAGLATTVVKADEPGLLALARSLNVPISFYEKDELNSVKTIQNPSSMVEKHLGVKSVCEAAAILASHNGKLVVPKIKKGNATLAVARIEPDCL